MAEDGVMPQGEAPKREMSEEEINKRKEELFLEFCQERGIDPKKIDATELGIFYETPEMQALLARKYRRGPRA
jgi:predicted HicB family RNase H-like nuclease